MLELNKIYCGDCLDYLQQMEDKSVDLVLTDPPYGIKESNERNLARGGPVGFGGNKKIGCPVPATDYGHYEWDKHPPTKEYFNELFRISKNQIIFGGNYFELLPSPCWIVWDKDNGNNDFADCELAWTSFKSAVRKFKYRWNGLLQQDMAHKEKRTHPTQKPLKLMEWILNKYSKEGDLICDPFMGSGPVIEAASKLNRRYIGIDICQEYCDMAQKRLERVNNKRLSEFF